jgi:hypothetical protein
MVKWAETDSDVLHYSKIAQECLKAMTNLRPHLTVILRDKAIVRGWLEGLTQGNNAGEDVSALPTSWYGSIILQEEEREIEFDFLDIETVYSTAPPQLIDKIDPADKLSAANGD